MKITRSLVLRVENRVLRGLRDLRDFV